MERSPGVDTPGSSAPETTATAADRPAPMIAQAFQSGKTAITQKLRTTGLPARAAWAATGVDTRRVIAGRRGGGENTNEARGDSSPGHVAVRHEGKGGIREDRDGGTAPTQFSCPQGEEKTSGYDQRHPGHTAAIANLHGQKWDDTLPLRLNPSLCLSVPPQLTLRRAASKLSDPHLHGGRQTGAGQLDFGGLGGGSQHDLPARAPQRAPCVDKCHMVDRRRGGGENTNEARGHSPGHVAVRHEGKGGIREDRDGNTVPTQISYPQGEEKMTGYDQRHPGHTAAIANLHGQKWDDTLPLRLNPSLCLSVPPQLTLRWVASKLSDPHLHGGRQTRPGEIDTIGLGERLHH
jgi:hypothetical protein